VIEIRISDVMRRSVGDSQGCTPHTTNTCDNDAARFELSVIAMNGESNCSVPKDLFGLDQPTAKQKGSC
jgi:hypothetical protein